MSNVNFNGCKHLDFDRAKYSQTCDLEFTTSGAFWMRKKELLPHLNAPRMVQYCKLRGRLNDPCACLGARNARCREYEEVAHEVEEDRHALERELEE